LVEDRKFDLACLAGADARYRDATRRQIEAGLLDLLHGELVDEAVQCDVGVGLASGLAGGLGEVEAADGGEVLLEGALAQEVACVFPFVVAALHEVIDTLATPAQPEDELVR